MKPCPQCRCTMEAPAAAGLAGAGCPQCGGSGCDREASRPPARRGAAAFSLLGRGASGEPPPAGADPPDPVCPTCRLSLHPVSFSHARDVKALGCRECGGLWFRRGELAALARYVPAPGGGHGSTSRPGEDDAAVAPTQPHAGPAGSLQSEIQNPRSASDPCRDLVGREFRVRQNRLVARALRLGLPPAAFLFVVGWGLTFSSTARGYSLPVWAIGGVLTLLYVGLDCWWQAGTSIGVEPDGLVQRTRMRTYKTRWDDMLLLRHQGETTQLGGGDSRRGGCGGWEFGQDPGNALLITRDVSFEIVAEGDWRDRITFSEEYEDWEALVGAVTYTLDRRHGLR